MPIGDFLHASRHEFDDIKSRLKVCVITYFSLCSVYISVCVQSIFQSMFSLCSVYVQSMFSVKDFALIHTDPFIVCRVCLKADEERRCKELRQQKFVNGRSEKMLGKMRLREARRIFQTLRATYDDAQGGEEEGGKGKGAARLATHLVDIEAVDVDVLGVVAPLLAALAPDKVSLDVTEFCGMLDEDYYLYSV